MRSCLAALIAVTALSLALAQTPDKSGRPRPLELAPPLLKFGGHGGTVNCIAFAPDGKTIATGGTDKTIAIWDAKTGKELRRFPAHINDVWTVAFTPDGKRLASGGRADFVVRWWDPATGQSLGGYEGHRGGIPHLAFIGDRQLLSAGGSWDPRILLWDLGAGKEVRVFKGHTNLVRVLAVSADGALLASVSDDGSARLWDVATGRERCLLAVDPSEALCCLAMTADGRTVAVGGTDGSLRLVETCTGQLRLPKIEHEDAIRALLFTPDGKTLIAGADDGLILFFDPSRLRQRHSIQAHGPVSRHLALSPDGKLLASVGTDGRLFDVSKQLEVKPRPATQPSRHELEVRWQELAGDAVKAYRTIPTLIDGQEQAVPFLTERLKPVGTADSERTTRLIKVLESDVFRIRDAAAKELEQIGDQAGPALRQALARSPSLDLQRRLERLLARLEPIGDPDMVRALRCLEVLEHAGSPEARRVVEMLAKGAAEARVTVEAKRTLGRMEVRVKR